MKSKRMVSVLFFCLMFLVGFAQSGKAANLIVIDPKPGTVLIKDPDIIIEGPVIKWSCTGCAGNLRVHVYLNDAYYTTVAASEPVGNGDIGSLFNPPSSWPSVSDRRGRSFGLTRSSGGWAKEIAAMHEGRGAQNDRGGWAGPELSFKAQAFCCFEELAMPPATQERTLNSS